MSKKTQTEAAVLSISPNSALECIESAICMEQPLMMWGPPGIGKSELVHQIAAKQGRKVRDVRLALYDPTDLKGMPYLSKDDTLKWAPSSEIPFLDPDCDDILFLDELPSAPPSVQAAAYQLVLNRRIGEHVLPAKCSIIAAGNRDNDRGVTYKMPKPLANRFVHIELRVDADEWINHAINKGVHKDIVSYISHMKQDLFVFDPASASHSFATPRTWFFLDRLLKKCENVNKDTLATMIAGSIGDGIAVKFLQHRKIAEKLPKAIEVLDGSVTTLDTKDISACYSLIISLCYEIKIQHDKKAPEKLLKKYMENYINYMMDNFEPEMIMVGIKILVRNYNIDIDVSESASYEKFHKKFGKYINS
jgi:midasin (ATPase involved in ribosome maturation)